MRNLSRRDCVESDAPRIGEEAATPGMHCVMLSRTRYTGWTRELMVTDGVPTKVGGLLEQTTAQNPCATETPAGR